MEWQNKICGSRTNAEGHRELVSVFFLIIIRKALTKWNLNKSLNTVVQKCYVQDSRNRIESLNYEVSQHHTLLPFVPHVDSGCYLPVGHTTVSAVWSTARVLCSSNSLIVIGALAECFNSIIYLTSLHHISLYCLIKWQKNPMNITPYASTYAFCYCILSDWLLDCILLDLLLLLLLVNSSLYQIYDKPYHSSVCIHRRK